MGWQYGRSNYDLHRCKEITRDLQKLRLKKYDVLSKTFRNGSAIYIAVVVARSTGPNRPNCEFRYLLRSFATTARKRAKTSPQTLARTDLAASPWQRTVSHFHLHPALTVETQNGCHILHTPYSPDLAPCDFFLLPKMILKPKGRPLGHILWAVHTSNSPALHNPVGFPGLDTKKRNSLFYSWWWAY
jgi:hypothetical protein